MNKPVNTTFVLDLSRIKGLARQFILKSTLSKLSQLGYKWFVTPPCALDVTRVIVNATGQKINHLFFDNNPLFFSVSETITFNDGQLEDFLLQAEALVLISSTSKEGITATISPFGLALNLNDAVKRATNEAHQKAEEVFDLDLKQLQPDATDGLNGI